MLRDCISKQSKTSPFIRLVGTPARGKISCLFRRSNNRFGWTFKDFNLEGIEIYSSVRVKPFPKQDKLRNFYRPAMIVSVRSFRHSKSCTCIFNSTCQLHSCSLRISYLEFEFFSIEDNEVNKIMNNNQCYFFCVILTHDHTYMIIPYLSFASMIFCIIGLFTIVMFSTTRGWLFQVYIIKYQCSVEALMHKLVANKIDQ